MESAQADLEVLVSNILALDQASKTSGYSVFKDGKLHTYGKFTFEDADLGERLCKIKNKVIELINEYDIDELIFEDIQLQNNVTQNVQTFKVLAEVYGLIDQVASELKIPHRSYLASSWKSQLGIKGKDRAEQKRNAQKYVLNTYNVKCTQDEADAICIGDCATKRESLNGFICWSQQIKPFFFFPISIRNLQERRSKKCQNLSSNTGQRFYSALLLRLAVFVLKEL